MINKKNSIIFIIICLLILTNVFLHTSFKNVTKPVQQIFYSINIIPKPETFTELYFNNNDTLPFEILPQKTYSFSFIIHNLENKPMTYQYSAYIQTYNNKIPLTKGTKSLYYDKFAKIPITFSTDSALLKSKVIVALVNKKQTISFWVNE